MSNLELPRMLSTTYQLWTQKMAYSVSAILERVVVLGGK